MNAQDLKNSILQLAIQGKLVEQRVEEGTAKELLENIEAKKKNLIEEGKIKKQKALPAIKEDEIPFDIPESWEWVRFGEMVNFNMGKTPPRSELKYWGDDYNWVSIADMVADGYIFETKEKISEIGLKEKFKGSLVPKGTLLMSFKLTVGKVSILNIDAVHNEAIISIYPYSDSEETIRNYLFTMLPLLSTYGETKGAIKGKTLNSTSLNNLLIPAPPLGEQKRIIEKIKELMPYVDKYNLAYSEVEELNKSFSEDMQKSILQYAIQGKLVEQRKEDGMAEELYKQIQEEKNKLIKEGKIKKTKALPEITENEYPFDIPENWKWVRLGNIVSLLGDGIHGTPVYDNSGDYYFINGNNLNDGIIKIKDDTKRVKEDQFIKHKRDLNENTVLVSINGTIGNVAFYGREKVILGKSACYFNLIVEDFKYYLYWVIKTKYFLDYAINKATGTTIKNVSLATMREFAIPLPPLEEQKRIVEKIQEILPYTKQLVK
ncbi:MAG: restriction endonuclease [Trichococcus flocculiformis]|uniref:Restriction endonuclease n=1 Tax=Trichococcus flocculiformis TaxID=82803 RepID=A0A847D477_9LACT|nr:restriction endonuclease subunit S [Trichococcus flocculiformis]NLD32121.1 restriction endonuclease [Trichococcus flocculiformis]